MIALSAPHSMPAVEPRLAGASGAALSALGLVRGRAIVSRVNARPRVGIEERRARVGIRHRLAPGTQVSTVAEAAGAVVALHATDSASVFLQARARMSRSSPGEIDRELYEERSVLRMLAMRRTMFTVPIGEVPILHAAASLAVGRTERKRTLAMLTAAGSRTQVRCSRSWKPSGSLRSARRARRRPPS